MTSRSAPLIGDASGDPRAEPGAERRWLFGSFFLGGFECSDHVGRDGRRHDLIAETQHDALAAEDYALCRRAGIEAVRESARWPFAEHGGRLDLDHVRRLAHLGRESGLTLIWDLFHYGYPEDLDDRRPGFEDRLLERFAAFAGEVAQVVKAETDGPRWYTPVNEISYSGWACGEVGYMAPFWHGRGLDYKRLLVRLQVTAVQAVDAVDPEARILSVDPLVRLHVHPEITDPAERAALQREADEFNTVSVPQALDMVAGLVEPELGGSARALGVVGLNYYDGNQWTIPTPRFTRAVLATGDPGAIPLSTMLQQTADRYRAPVILAETGASAEARVPWLRLLTAECRRALEMGVDLQGVCIYPVVTSPDWDDQTAFFDGGLFDVAPRPDGTLERRIMGSVRDAFLEAQHALDPDRAERATFDAPASPEPGRQPAVGPVDLPSLAWFPPDNFSNQTALASETMAVEVYGLEVGGAVPWHRHLQTEHALTVLHGTADIWVDGTTHTLSPGQALIVPAGARHGIHNPHPARLVVQQVSSPKPWHGRFAGPVPFGADTVPDHSTNRFVALDPDAAAVAVPPPTGGVAGPVGG